MLQIIQWLLTAGQKVNKENTQRSKAFLAAEAKSRDVIPFNRACAPAHSLGYEEENSKEKNCKNSLGLLLGGVDRSTALFYGTLKHRMLGLKPDFINTTVSHGHMAGIHQVGRDVLPLRDACMYRASGINHGISGCPKSKLHRGGGEKGRALSKMKELLRWSAASNPDGEGSKRWKVLYFRNRGALGSGRYDNEPSNSSILNCKYDVGNHSTYSASSEQSIKSSSSWRRRALAGQTSHPNAISISACIVKEPRKRGSWITTDSDYVVLEL